VELVLFLVQQEFSDHIRPISLTSFFGPCHPSAQCFSWHYKPCNRNPYWQKNI